MSQASEWVAKWTDATLPRTDPMGWHVDPPRPHWGIGRLNAIAIVEDDGGLQMEQCSMSPANAIAFAYWILAVFSERSEAPG